MPDESLILHITTRDAWTTATAAGRYTTPNLDSEGFIHGSTRDQVVDTANRIFRGHAGLVLLCIESSRVGPEIRYENLEGGSTQYPHIYGPLNLDAVTDVLEFAPNADGIFTLPAVLR